MARSADASNWRAPQFRALLEKGRLARRQQSSFGWLKELFLPLVLVVPFAFARLLGESAIDMKSGVDRAVHLGDPFATKYAARLCKPGGDGIFVVAPAQGLGEEFQMYLKSRFGTRPAGWPEIWGFKDGDEVEGYVRSEQYGEAHKPPLCGALIFDLNGSSYTLRLNGTIVGNRGAVCGGVDTRRVTTRRSIDGPMTSQDWYLCSGFLAFQSLADDFLLKRVGDNQLPKGRSNSPRPMNLELDILPFPTPSFKRRAALSSLREPIALATTMFFAYAVGQVTSTVVAERESKLLDAMKLMGLKDQARYAAFIVQAVPIFVLYGLEFALGLAFGIFTHSSLWALALFLGLSGAAAASAALCASALFDSARMASLVGIVGTFALSRMQVDQMLACLVPPIALVQGLSQVVELELSGSGLQAEHLEDVLGGQMSMGTLMLMQLLSIPFFLLLWVYLDRVVPHQYGSAALPWYRPWSAFAVEVDASGRGTMTRHRVPLQTPGIVEHSLPVACTVEIKGLRKEYEVLGGRPARRVVAVRKLDLGLCEGEILALLGHNGAGKSTTVGMLTGVIQPSKGSVTIHGFDVSRQPLQARCFLGVCPQHDILFDSLSCDEHLGLAMSLKGVKALGDTAAHDLLRVVGLWGQLATAIPAGQLSSGRRRALCVALAFVGDPRFIILDEPTSGMDPFVRRTMWELLKKHRPGRVLCLSTHYMDEAEMLGDQVCILSRGSLQCHGSPDWLKARLGSGYMLTLTRSGTEAGSMEQAARAALDLLQRISSQELQIARCAGNEAVLRVPFSVGSIFPELLASLDSQKAKIGFASVTVSATTLEELFLRLADGEGEEASVTTPEQKQSSHAQESTSLSVQAASSMASVMADLAKMPPPARASKAWQGSALLLKRWQSIRRSKRAMLCLCFLPLLFNVLGLASIAASFELDSPPLEIFSVAGALKPNLGNSELPRLVVPYSVAHVRGWGRSAQIQQGKELLRTGVNGHHWHEVQYLETNQSLLDATMPRRFMDDFVVDAGFTGGQPAPDALAGLDLSKFQEMRRKGAPEFVIRKVMEKDGVPASTVEQFLSAGGEPAATGDGSMSGRLRLGLRDHVEVSLNFRNMAAHEASLQLMFGQAPVRVDNHRPDQQRQELVKCASGGPVKVMLAEEAMRRLSDKTRESLLTMQEGGAPAFAQQAFLEQAGVPPEDVNILASSSSPEAVPRKHLQQLRRCAHWQAFAHALLDSRASLASSRFGAIFVEHLDLHSRHGRLAIFQNDSVFHSAPLFLGLAQRAAAIHALQTPGKQNSSAMHKLEVGVTNWPLPLTQQQRQRAFSTQGWSFFTMALIGASFLPASLAADAAQEIDSGAVRQQALAGMPLSTFIMSSFFADFIMTLPPLLTQLLFVRAMQLAVFVDCLEILAVLLTLFALASTAQVYALLPELRSASSAQSSVLALNVILGFFLALGVWILAIPFLGDTANTISRCLCLLGRLSPSFNLSNAILTIPNTSLSGFGTVHGLPVSDWQVAGEPLAGLVANFILYMSVALTRSGRLRFGKPGLSKRRQLLMTKTPRRGERQQAAEVLAEKQLVDDALQNLSSAATALQSRGLVIGGLSVSYDAVDSKSANVGHTAALQPLSIAVSRGTALGVLGISGSGKSTMLAALAGALPQDSRTVGTLRLDGKDILGLKSLPVGTVGYAPQGNELTHGLTVREQISLFGRLRGLSGKQLVTEVSRLCSELELDAFEESRSENLSGGNQRKLQCACALVGSPRLICLDEPSAGLDPMARRSLCRALRSSLTTVSAAVVATKSIDEAEGLCSKLAILNKDGCLSTVGTAVEIRNRYGGGHELRVSLQRPTMAEVYEGIAEQRDPESMAHFLQSCTAVLGGDICDERGLRGFAAGLAAGSGPRLPYGSLLQELFAAPWAAGLGGTSSSEALEDGDAYHDLVLPEDSLEMRAELGSRTNRVVTVLRPFFPCIQCVEEVSLMRVFQIHDERPRTLGAGVPDKCTTKSSNTLNVADIFRNVEDRKQELRIADYSITQASLEHVFNQFAMQDQSKVPD